MTDATLANAPVEDTKPKRAPRTRKAQEVAPTLVQDAGKEVELRKPQRKAVKHSQPIFEQVLTIHSLQGQRVMDRSFRALSGSLFRCEVILRIVGDEKANDAVEAKIADGLNKAAAEVESEIAQAQAVMQANGIDALPTYTNTKRYKIQIKTPQIANFARMVVKLDELMSLIDALWLMGGIIPTKQRMRQTWEWQQRLIRLANQIISLERRAREAAYRKGKGDEVEEVVPVGQLEADEKLLMQDEDALEDTSDAEDEQPA